MGRRAKTPVASVVKSQGLTDKRILFVENIVLHSMKQGEAAAAAGFAGPAVAASQLMRNPQILEAIRLARMAAVDGELAGVALTTLKEVMQDKDSPASARVSAAKGVLQVGGYFERGKTLGKLGDKDRKPLSEMTPAQLNEAIAEMRKELDEASTTIDEVVADGMQTIDITDIPA